MKNRFELSINFFRKVEQFFMGDFLHSKYPKRRRICGMSRADINMPFIEIFLKKISKKCFLRNVVED